MADVDVGDYLDLLATDGADAGDPALSRDHPARAQVPLRRPRRRPAEAGDRDQGRAHAAARRGRAHPYRRARPAPTRWSRRRCAGPASCGCEGLAEMFAAAETVARFRPLDRARLGDRDQRRRRGGAGGRPAGRERRRARRARRPKRSRPRPALPRGWSGANPVDILGDAPPERYLAALEAVAADDGVDVVLVMNCPTVLATARAAARAVAGGSRRALIGGKPVLACWLGGRRGPRARRGAARGRGGELRHPGAAAAAVGHLTDWGRAQAALLRVPDRGVEDARRRRRRRARAAAAIFRGGRGAGRARC